MKELFQNKYRVESARLPNYDYGQPGYYFITICTKNRRHYFSDIIDGEMILNDVGQIAARYWLEIPKHFSNVVLDEFIIMPNHIHGIIEIRKNDGVNCRDEALPRLYTPPPRLYTGKYPNMSKISPKSKSLSVIIGSFKSICTKTINKIYGTNHFAWQSRFYEHIVRNEISLHNIQQYIYYNPQMWHRDRNNLENLLM